MKYNGLVMAAIAIAIMALVPLLTPGQVGADGVEVFESACKQSNNTELCKGNTEELFGADSIWTRIVNMIIFIVGAVAVLMIVIGGLRYTLSGGDQSAVSTAKNTIIYSVVGLVVSLMSFAIVNFVLARI